MQLVHVLKVVLSPWSPWKGSTIDASCALAPLYLGTVLPLAAIGPLIELILYLGAPFHSALLPPMSLTQLLYNLVRDTACGGAVVFAGASVILGLARRFGAATDAVLSHRLAVAACCPALLVIALRPFMEGTARIELLAVGYGWYLLSTGLPTMLGADRRTAGSYAALVTFATLAMTYAGDFIFIMAQLWVVRALA